MSKKVLPQHEVTLFVDDIREEKNGKISLMGLYGKDILLDPIQPLPVLFPKFCIFIRYCGGDGEFVVKGSLKDPDGEEVIKDSDNMKIKTQKEQVGNIIIILSPFVIKKEGEYKFSLSLDNNEFSTTNILVKARQFEKGSLAGSGL